MNNDRILVISAHAADYVWRAGGIIAKYIKHGAPVDVVVLSFGIRGESNDLWKGEGQTAEKVREIRLAETTKAAGILGISNLEFWDLPDYPIPVDAMLRDRLIRKIRETRPTSIISHDRFDILNPDHTDICELVFRCSVQSNSSGVVTPGLKTTSQMQIFGFEPHQTELCNYMPGIFVDITETYEQKVAAMECFAAQGHLIEYYKQRAAMRGNHARRLSGKKEYKYAESFARFFPLVAEKLL